jgi:hypothetical protein
VKLPLNAPIANTINPISAVTTNNANHPDEILGFELLEDISLIPRN